MTLADRSAQELWVCHLGVVPYLDALAIQETLAPGARPTRCPTRCCCSSTRRSTPGGAARAPTTCRFGEDFYRARASRSSTRPRRADHLPRPGTARRLSDHGGSATWGATCARWSGRSSPRSRVHRGARPRAATDRTTPASGWRSARSPRSASTSRAASPPMASPSTSTTTSSPFEWVVACGLPDVQMTSIALERARRRSGPHDAAFKRMATARRGTGAPAPSRAAARDRPATPPGERPSGPLNRSLSRAGAR